jgi:hypothetical protein
MSLHDASVKLELYKTAVEFADRVSARRQQMNTFYLSISTLILGLHSTLKTPWVVPFAGMIIAVFWYQSIRTSKALNSAKYKIIHKIEEGLPFQIFKDEWECINSQPDKKHKTFTSIEKGIPVVFLVIYFIQIVTLFPLSKVIKAILCGVH